MDTVRGMDDRMGDDSIGYDDAGVSDSALSIGTDERRMHVRAYNHWVSLLHGRAYPSIEDLDPHGIADFGPHSVLLDFSKGIQDPAIQFLGRALREECGIDESIRHVGQVPSRSLLSRLTDHYLQIIANRAPIGFEAEFVGQRGHNTMYRGILMPFSSDEDTIDFIFGVINWKEMVDAETQAKLNAEIAAVRRSSPQVAGAVWADGPGSAFAASSGAEPEPEHADVAVDFTPLGDDAGLGDRLMLARETAAAARASDTRSRAALYRALGRAHDFALATDDDPDGYAELLADAGVTVQARAPMTAVVKLVFGTDYDKTRVTEFAAVLSNARRTGIDIGALAAHLDAVDGGIKAMVKAERAARRPTGSAPLSIEAAAESLRMRAALAQVALASGDAEFVVLLARANAEGLLDIVAQVADDSGLTERVMRRIVG